MAVVNSPNALERTPRPGGSLDASGPAAPTDSAWRTLAYFSLARVMVSSALLLSLAVFGAPLFGRGTPAEASAPIVALSLLYFVGAAAFAFAALYVRSNFLLQVGGQLAVDLVIITALSTLGGGMRSGMTILYFLPLAGGSLLLPSIAAFFICAVAVIALLFDAVLRQLQVPGLDAVVFQAGLYGAALFGLTALLRLLSQRLAEQERLAQLRGRDLENQLEINRLVIAQMEQGVLVIDAGTRVRANNRAARMLLGLPATMQLTGHRLTDYQTLAPLTRAFAAWLDAERATGAWSNSVVQSISPANARGETQHAMPELQLRARFARPPSAASDEFVIFLEDVRAIEERAQQLKLAAMGRLTASIAHEIRNPLAAISHAGQMLAEESRDPLPQRLSAIVKENTVRLNRLVEDVLRVARREPPVGDELDLGLFVQEWLGEFMRDRGVAAGMIRLSARPEIKVKFEQSHLRQVLFNLVDNALRYSSGKANCVDVVVERSLEDGERARLWVFDDGPGVTPESRGALFEPFYTTHARGTGLGLYIAREFCLANRSDLGYGGRRELDGSIRTGFEVRFARVPGAGAAEFGFLDTAPVR
jgi:two-component system sensor histidine kinase PilS (NtrC family)